jgi:LmbE family N-acetylglucosaminyl deacetylase
VLDDAEISRILSITAHPDDVDFAAAGTVARWTEAESLAAWTVREVWIAGGPDPNHYVDVTETFPRKIAALRAHESQIAQMEDLAERIRTRLTLVAGQAGLPGGRLAEGFRVLDTA